MSHFSFPTSSTATARSRPAARRKESTPPFSPYAKHSVHAAVVPRIAAMRSKFALNDANPASASAHDTELFVALEAHCAPNAEPGLYCGHHYTAPLCSSANRSGAPGGSITTLERAEEFAHARKIPLMILCDPEPAELGSYPIFCLHPNRISLSRPGPGDAAIRARFHPHLLAP